MDKLSQAVDNAQPGQHRPLRIVLVGLGRAEEGQHGVAHQPGDHAAILLDGGDHVAERLVHHLGPLFGVETAGQRRRADHVAEQHGDDAPLARGNTAGVARGRWGGAGRAATGGVRRVAEGIDHRRRGMMKSSSS